MPRMRMHNRIYCGFRKVCKESLHPQRSFPITTASRRRSSQRLPKDLWMDPQIFWNKTMREIIEYLIFTVIFIASSATFIWLIISILTNIYNDWKGWRKGRVKTQDSEVDFGCFEGILRQIRNKRSFHHNSTSGGVSVASLARATYFFQKY